MSTFCPIYPAVVTYDLDQNSFPMSTPMPLAAFAEKTVFFTTSNEWVNRGEYYLFKLDLTGIDLSKDTVQFTIVLDEYITSPVGFWAKNMYVHPNADPEDYTVLTLNRGQAVHLKSSWDAENNRAFWLVTGNYDNYRWNFGFHGENPDDLLPVYDNPIAERYVFDYLEAIPTPRERMNVYSYHASGPNKLVTTGVSLDKLIVDVLDLNTGAWSSVASSISNHIDSGRVKVGDSLYIAGGYNTATRQTSNLFARIDSNGTITQLAALPATLRTPVVLINQGAIYVCGGYTPSWDQSDAVYKYTIATNTWTTEPAMSRSVADVTGAVHHNNKAYIFGGYGGVDDDTNYEITVYDFTTKQWSTEPIDMGRPNAEYWATSIGQAGNLVFFAGGFLTFDSNDAGGTRDIWVYNLDEKWWSKHKFVIDDLMSGEIIIIGDKLYIVSGNVNPYGSPTPMSEIVSYRWTVK